MKKIEGSGWRVANDPSKEVFPFLIGCDHWAVELTLNEWTQMSQIVCELIHQHECLINQILPQEKIFIELEKKSWWACLEGNKDDWSLRLILSGNESNRRGFEMFWPIPIAKGIIEAVRNM